MHLVYKSSTLQSSMYVHSMYKAPPTAKLEIKISSCCYLTSCLNWFRHGAVHTRSPLRHPSYSSLQTCSLCHHGSDWNLQTFHCFRYCIHAFAVQHTLQPSLAFCHTSTSLVPIPFPLLSPTSQGENNIFL